MRQRGTRLEPFSTQAAGHASKIGLAGTTLEGKGRRWVLSNAGELCDPVGDVYGI